MGTQQDPGIRPLFEQQHSGLGQGLRLSSTERTIDDEWGRIAVRLGHDVTDDGHLVLVQHVRTDKIERQALITSKGLVSHWVISLNNDIVF